MRFRILSNSSTTHKNLKNEPSFRAVHTEETKKIQISVTSKYKWRQYSNTHGILLLYLHRTVTQCDSMWLQSVTTLRTVLGPIFKCFILKITVVFVPTPCTVDQVAECMALQSRRHPAASLACTPQTPYVMGVQTSYWHAYFIRLNSPNCWKDWCQTIRCHSPQDHIMKPQHSVYASPVSWLLSTPASVAARTCSCFSSVQFSSTAHHPSDSSPCQCSVASFLIYLTTPSLLAPHSDECKVTRNR